MITNLIKEKLDIPLKLNWFKKNFFLNVLPKCEEDMTIVLENSKSATYVERKSANFLQLNEFTAYYMVDLSQKNVVVMFYSPSKESPYDFEIEVEFICTPKDPIVVVKNNITNLEVFLEKAILNILSNKTIHYNPDQVFEVRTDLVKSFEEIEAHIKKTYKFDIERTYLTVKMDSLLLDYLRRIKSIEYETNIKKKLYIQNHSEHFELKDELLKQVGAAGFASMLVDDYINNNDSGKKLLQNTLSAELERHKLKLKLFEEAKGQGVISNQINEYVDDIFKTAKLEKILEPTTRPTLEKTSKS